MFFTNASESDRQFITELKIKLYEHSDVSTGAGNIMHGNCSEDLWREQREDKWHEVRSF